LSFDDDDLAVDPLVVEPPLVEAREAERPLGKAQAQPLERPADASERREILAPVTAAPELVPVDDLAGTCTRDAATLPRAARSRGTTGSG
jgi:hypothetical protein